MVNKFMGTLGGDIQTCRSEIKLENLTNCFKSSLMPYFFIFPHSNLIIHSCFPTFMCLLVTTGDIRRDRRLHT